MTFLEYKDTIEENDLAILYINFTTIIPVTVKPMTLSKKGTCDVENIYQTKYGSLKAMDLVGKKFGSKVQLSKGYGYILHPTPDLWTKCLPHRTQILYSTDISMILLQLELKPGSVVVESGTGSGSLSHAFARTIAPSGHLHTFDFHEERADKARKEFQEHGLDKNVTVRHRDVCAGGFELENVADAVFLDLPHPWEVVKHAKDALRTRGGRLCSFSPCIEQVQRTCLVLKEAGFTELSTLECLNREFQVRKITLPVFDPELDPLAESRKRRAEEEEKDQVGEKRKRADEGKERAEGKETQFVTGLPLTNMAGHTGYLTFATLPAKSQ